MSTREFKSGDEVSVVLPDGTLDTGWRIFTVNEELKIAILAKEVGSEIESRKASFDELR